MSDTTHPPFPSADNERDPQLPDVPDSLSEEQYDQYTSLYDDPPSTENRVVSMYLSRAQARDSALVEKWTSEMDSILFVATLFSAVVIASLIDHQSQLRRDPTDTTNALLSSISLQLTQLGNGSSQQPFNLDAWSRSHRVRPLNYAVGAFWWTSLFTSLFSSALALFVKQWSRHYLEKTTAPRSLWDRVAASSFLHAGLEDSMMRQLVELIPALFHLSMFFYFLGASMQQSDDQRHIIPPLFIPIALYLVLYAALTLNPLINPRSPISTPLSPVFWKLRLWFSCCIGYRAEETLALKQARLIRNGADQNVLGAVQWTLKSISNDAEAAEFLEGVDGDTGPVHLESHSA
ncbi:hypothetical protein BC834DRAFT_153227 [Gloeopeniophorella convolvens]|nr:hypothetical protein BC834DRAFT_153227 [Gloeopeniophorella convolvens]